MKRAIEEKRVDRTTYIRNLTKTHSDSEMLMVNIPKDIVRELKLTPKTPTMIKLQRPATVEGVTPEPSYVTIEFGQVEIKT
jgi:hypothetical protein